MDSMAMLPVKLAVGNVEGSDTSIIVEALKSAMVRVRTSWI